jgi:hypothetical protein
MDARGKPSVEDVVRRWEARPVELVDTRADMEVMIAAWRERGAQLEGASLAIEKLNRAYDSASAALKDKP